MGETDLMTVRETADFLGTSEKWVRRRIDAGDLPALRLGSHRNAPVRIARSDLAAWVRAASWRPAVERRA